MSFGKRSEEVAAGMVLAAAVAIALIVACPYAGSWNDGSRLATVESLVDRHTWIIDNSTFVQALSPERPRTPLPYDPRKHSLLEHGTLDKLFINGHYYSDKSPVPALLMAGVYQLWQWTTGETAHARPDRFCWTMTFACSGLAYVLAVWCIYRLGRRLDLSLWLRLSLAGSFAVSTVALPYARQVNNHILLLAVTAALALAVAALCEERKYSQASWRRFATLGTLAGWAYTIDLGAGPVILLCTSIFVLCSRDARRSAGLPPHSAAHRGYTRERKRFLTPFLVFMLAALPWLMLHHALNYAIGGSFKPANANPDYFRWPGSPFAAGNLTGSWIHPNFGSFLLYAASMLAGKRGFLGHNLPLFLMIPALFILPRRHREIRVEVFWAIGCWIGTWLLYAAVSNNSSGQCCTIRWFVPLLAPAYLILALLLRYYPHYRADFLLLSAWGTLLVFLMREGPWLGGMIRFFWPIQGAALCGWAICHQLRRRKDQHLPADRLNPALVNRTAGSCRTVAAG